MSNNDLLNCAIIDGQSGRVRTGEAAVPLYMRDNGDEVIDMRQKELETFLKCLAFHPLNEVILKEKSLIFHAGGEETRAWWLDFKTKGALVDFLTCTKNHKVDGNKWCNGILGSRWADTELNGRKCRLAFYSRIGDPKSFESKKTAGKDYVIRVCPNYHY
jgi:hypothetical protein